MNVRHFLTSRRYGALWAVVILATCSMVQSACFAGIQSTAAFGIPAVEESESVPNYVKLRESNAGFDPTPPPVPTIVSSSFSKVENLAQEVRWPYPSSDSLPWWIDHPEETSLETRIRFADVIARVNLLSYSVQTYRLMGEHHEMGLIPYFVRALEFEFEVVEYLKGSGNGTIYGIVPTFGGALTEEEAQELSSAETTELMAIRDNYLFSRWDDRQAIVFLRRSGADESFRSAMYPVSTILEESDRYWLGDLSRYYETYSIASPHNKAWLPSTSPGDRTRSADEEQTYLLDVPRGYLAGGLTASTKTSEIGTLTISLSTIESMLDATPANDVSE